MFFSPHFDQIKYVFTLLSFLKVIEPAKMSFVKGLFNKVKFLYDEGIRQLF
jgi:hypothetical protein